MLFLPPVVGFLALKNLTKGGGGGGHEHPRTPLAMPLVIAGETNEYNNYYDNKHDR